MFAAAASGTRGNFGPDATPREVNGSFSIDCNRLYILLTCSDQDVWDQGTEIKMKQKWPGLFHSSCFTQLQ